MRPLITIPIAAYKTRPSYLALAVESALAQSWQEIEVIVSDDSPDQALRSVVEQFRDSRVTYHHNSPRLGVARNHWRSFSQAKGDFIAVLNHDDLFAETFLEKLVQPLLLDPSLALAFCDHWVIDENGHQLIEATHNNTKVWGRDRLPAGAITPFYELFLSQSIPMVMGTVFRKSMLPAHLPEEAGPAYDLWLSYLLCREGFGAYFAPEKLSSWRTHSENLTSQGGLDWYHGAAECWSTASRDTNLSSVRRIARRKAAKGYYTAGVAAWKAGHSWNALCYGWRSLMALPTRKGLLVCFISFVPIRLASRLAGKA